MRIAYNAAIRGHWKTKPQEEQGKHKGLSAKLSAWKTDDFDLYGLAHFHFAEGRALVRGAVSSSRWDVDAGKPVSVKGKDARLSEDLIHAPEALFLDFDKGDLSFDALKRALSSFPALGGVAYALGESATSQEGDNGHKWHALIPLEAPLKGLKAQEAERATIYALRGHFLRLGLPVDALDLGAVGPFFYGSQGKQWDVIPGKPLSVADVRDMLFRYELSKGKERGKRSASTVPFPQDMEECEAWIAQGKEEGTRNAHAVGIAVFLYHQEWTQAATESALERFAQASSWSTKNVYPIVKWTYETAPKRRRRGRGAWSYERLRGLCQDAREAALAGVGLSDSSRHYDMKVFDAVLSIALQSGDPEFFSCSVRDVILLSGVSRGTTMRRLATMSDGSDALFRKVKTGTGTKANNFALNVDAISKAQEDAALKTWAIEVSSEFEELQGLAIFHFRAKIDPRVWSGDIKELDPRLPWDVPTEDGLGPAAQKIVALLLAARRGTLPEEAQAPHLGQDGTDKKDRKDVPTPSCLSQVGQGGDAGDLPEVETQRSALVSQPGAALVSHFESLAEVGHKDALSLAEIAGSLGLGGRTARRKLRALASLLLVEVYTGSRGKKYYRLSDDYQELLTALDPVFVTFGATEKTKRRANLERKLYHEWYADRYNPKSELAQVSFEAAQRAEALDVDLSLDVKAKENERAQLCEALGIGFVELGPEKREKEQEEELRNIVNDRDLGPRYGVSNPKAQSMEKKEARRIDQAWAIIRNFERSILKTEDGLLLPAGITSGAYLGACDLVGHEPRYTFRRVDIAAD